MGTRRPDRQLIACHRTRPAARHDRRTFPRESITFPREPVNLQNCMLLIEAIPEARNAFPILAKSSQHWAELIADWETLTESLRD